MNIVKKYSLKPFQYKKLTPCFFDKDPQELCKSLLGKVLFSRYEGHWLKARIIETEAYYRLDRASHSFRGMTPSRKAMFMPPGTIYMYYSRGKDSLNISCKGAGNAILIKSAVPYFSCEEDRSLTEGIMHRLNPSLSGVRRKTEDLCSGQTLLCSSLNIKLKEWNQCSFDENKFFIGDTGNEVKDIISTYRVGISQGKDEDLKLRFIDSDYLHLIRNKPKLTNQVFPIV